MNGIRHTAELVDRIARLCANDSNAAGLNPVQWEALRFFSRANRFSSNPSGLGRFLGLTKGTVSQTTIALEKKGLVRKVADPGDRRGVKVVLTAAGRKMLERDPLQALFADIESLPSRQVTALSQALEALLHSALERRGREPFGICRSCRHFRREHESGAPHYCALLETPLAEEESGLICKEQSA